MLPRRPNCVTQVSRRCPRCRAARAARPMRPSRSVRPTSTSFAAVSLPAPPRAPERAACGPVPRLQCTGAPALSRSGSCVRHTRSPGGCARISAPLPKRSSSWPSRASTCEDAAALFVLLAGCASPPHRRPRRRRASAARWRARRQARSDAVVGDTRPRGPSARRDGAVRGPYHRLVIRAGQEVRARGRANRPAPVAARSARDVRSRPAHASSTA